MRKYFKRLSLALIMALVFAMFVPVQKTEATSGLTQPAVYTNKIVLDINPDYLPSGSISNIYVDVRVNNENFNRIATLAGNTIQITVSGVSPLNSYDVRVSCDYTSTYGSKYTDSFIGSVYDAAVAPVKVTGLKQNAWYGSSGSLYTLWNAQEGATGYEYQLYNSKNKVVRKGTIAYDYRSRADFTKLASQTYKMRVRAYTLFNGSKVYGAWSNFLNIVPPVKTLKGKSASKRAITLNWSKVAGATSYTILVSTKRNSGYKVTKTVSAKTLKATIKKIGKSKLKSGKYYYVMVRPNKKVSGKNKFSTIKNASIPYVYGRVK